MENINLILICAVSALAVTVLVLGYSTYKLSEKLKRFMGTKSTKHNLESILTDYYDYVMALDRRYEKIENQVDELFELNKPCVQKIGIVRYNPFDDMGGDLSYAIAMLDGNDNGMIINTLFSRENSRTYCKPVEGGSSQYALSYEEETAVKRALGKDSQKPRGTEALKAGKI